MKRRSLEPLQPRAQAEEGLCRALLAMRDVGEMRAFLRDLCTPAEVEALVDRWSVVPHLLAGTPYREIHDLTAVSITTIGRVARYLNQGNGGYLAAAARAQQSRKPYRAAGASMEPGRSRRGANAKAKPDKPRRAPRASPKPGKPRCAAAVRA
ncbi:MAG: DNA-binding transcriptional regulator [Xanthomonadaceae bacterium]|nr:DNA-binding transcriptional regulator [Xanthomonadaceae bacterium]